MFGGDGAPMHQGRSLTYRMATTAPLWLGALTGHTPLPPGTTRRLAEGVLQAYSGPASPYWASKGFLGLLLPAGHGVWTAVEEAGPAELADAVTPFRGPNWLIQSTAADGLVRLHNHGSQDARYDPHYSRLAYSTATGPVPQGRPQDNHFGLLGADGLASPRTRIEPLGTGDGWAASRSRAGDARVISLVLAQGPTEVRVHLVTGAPAGTPVRQTGWAADDALRSELHPVHGLAAAPGLPPAPTAYADAVTAPALAGTSVSAGDGTVGSLHVCLARLTAGPDPAPLRTLVQVQVRVQAQGTGHHITARWPDGTVHRARLTPDGVTVESAAANGR
ncbi:DUF2264 domain-containing protein [Actinacidiphila oryziradicis]|uniref:DUF2264 domain-containing protein n=1 Tax=Actinacidiphila oryziradicis TaxID=2571141 RepID=A0A4U0SBC5_9ACTN|nr:DUF2264 domain-containing protein [Actinacidiphila oryziradicis]